MGQELTSPCGDWVTDDGSHPQVVELGKCNDIPQLYVSFA
jgi:hypothetical protein